MEIMQANTFLRGKNKTGVKSFAGFYIKSQGVITLSGMEVLFAKASEKCMSVCVCVSELDRKLLLRFIVVYGLTFYLSCCRVEFIDWSNGIP